MKKKGKVKSERRIGGGKKVIKEVEEVNFPEIDPTQI